MFLLVLLSAGAFGYFFVVREMTLYRSHVETYGKSVSNNLGALIEQVIGFSDQTTLQHLAEKWVKEGDIVLLTLSDKSGKQLAHAVKAGTLLNHQIVYHIIEPIPSKEGHDIGTLQIGLSLQTLEKQLSGLKMDIVLVSLGIFGVGVLFTLILTRILLRPIDKLATATE